MAAGVGCWEKPSGSPQPPVLQLLGPAFAFLGDLISGRAALALAFPVLPIAGLTEPVWEAIFLPLHRASVAALLLLMRVIFFYFFFFLFALACISCSPPVLPITPVDLV